MVNSFPPNLSMTLTHNQHKVFRQTIADYLDCNQIGDWVSEQERQRAIETDELWELHWYPDNPVSFFHLKASTFAALMAGID